MRPQVPSNFWNLGFGPRYANLRQTMCPTPDPQFQCWLWKSDLASASQHLGGRVGSKKSCKQSTRSRCTQVGVAVNVNCLKSLNLPLKLTATSTLHTGTSSHITGSMKTKKCQFHMQTRLLCWVTSQPSAKSSRS